MKRVVQGGILASIGYILSPLSWWNDLIVNIPLAYIFAIPFAAVSRKLFLPAMIVGYWLTNLLGMYLLHQGIRGMTKNSKKYTRQDLIRDLVISILYSILLMVLILAGILRFPLDY